MKKIILKFSIIVIVVTLFSSCAEMGDFIDGFYKGYYGDNMQKKNNVVDTTTSVEPIQYPSPESTL